MALSDARHAAESNDPQLGLWAKKHNVHLRHPSETFASTKDFQAEFQPPQADPRPTIADGQEELVLNT